MILILINFVVVIRERWSTQNVAFMVGSPLSRLSEYNLCFLRHTFKIFLVVVLRRRKQLSLNSFSFLGGQNFFQFCEKLANILQIEIVQIYRNLFVWVPHRLLLCWLLLRSSVETLPHRSIFHQILLKVLTWWHDKLGVRNIMNLRITPCRARFGNFRLQSFGFSRIFQHFTFFKAAHL